MVDSSDEKEGIGGTDGDGGNVDREDRTETNDDVVVGNKDCVADELVAASKRFSRAMVGDSASTGLVEGTGVFPNSKRSPCHVNLQNSDSVVDEVISWLREDIRANHRSFFEKYGQFVSVSELLGLIDGRFVDACKELIQLALTERELSFEKREPFRRDACVVLIYKFYRSLFFRRNSARQDGSSYFYGHLVETAKIAIRSIGLCGVVSIASAVGHDDYEDADKCGLQNFEPRDVVDHSLYLHRLDVKNSPELTRFSKKVEGVVRGDTKVTLETLSEVEELYGVKFQTLKEETFFQLLWHTRSEVRATLVKLADRLNNMRTIGAKSPESQKRIAEETEDIYIPLARILQVQEVTRELVDLCMQILNPNFYKEFKALSERRVSRLNKNRVGIATAIGGCAHVTDVRFQPFGLDHYIGRIDGRFRDMSLDKLGIGSADTMQEIVVIVDDSSSIKSAGMVDVVSALQMKKYTVTDLLEAPSPRSESNLDAGTDEEVFHEVGVSGGAGVGVVDGGSGGGIVGVALPDGSGDSAIVSKRREEASPSFVQRGMIINGFSDKFKCRLRVRINDRRSEYRLKGGVTVGSQCVDEHKRVVSIATRSDRVSTNFYSSIDSLIKLRCRGEIQDILEAAKEELLRPSTRFMTPHGDEYELPGGSTYLDASRKVHTDFLLGMLWVAVEGIADKSVRVNPLDEVPMVGDDVENLPVLTFGSCLSRRVQRDPDVLFKIRLHPGWVHFARNYSTKKRIYEFLADTYGTLGIEMPPEERDEAVSNIGREYVERLSRIFDPNLKDRLFRLHKDVPNENYFYYLIGRGDIDPFMDVVNFAKPCSTWHLEVEVPNVAGFYEGMDACFGRVGLSIRDRSSTRSGDVDRETFTVSCPESGNVPTFTLFKTLLKLSDEYKISVFIPRD